MTDDRWEAALDAYEDRLARQRVALAEPDPRIEPFEPPADLGPLPDDLVARARALLLEAEDLQRELAARVKAGVEAVPAAATAPTARPAAPAFLDTRV